ncbi:sensor histidine kinase [Arenibacter algicola]|uniref:sensor histidine kinase n=1 Tax=Arenibacter algicola TaxID=616991 RepID=UPI0004DFAB80|nr:ATP-binding protein [Arenibacter algicola]
MKNSDMIILLCNTRGVVEKVLEDSLGFFNRLTVPIDLNILVLPEVLTDYKDFWNKILNNYEENGTDLFFSANDNIMMFKASGYLKEDMILLYGHGEWSSDMPILNHLLPLTDKDQPIRKLGNKSKIQRGNNIYKEWNTELSLNEFTSLNNELVNKQRELMVINTKIESMNKRLQLANNNMKMFTYSVAHDLKEPLRMVNSFLSFYNDEYGRNLNGKPREYLDYVIDGAKRLDRMLTELMDYHKAVTYATNERVDLNEILTEVKEILKKEIEDKNAQITSEKLPIIFGSVAGCRQIFQNLIANALKFVPQGREPIVNIIYKEDKENYKFWIKDNGIGIPRREFKNIFTIFKRVGNTEEYEGSGMGLAIVKTIISNMGGEIQVESEEGKGSVFHFTIKKEAVN